MKTRIRSRCLCGLLFLTLISHSANADELAGVTVGFVGDPGSATLSVEAVEEYKLRIDVDPGMDPKPRSMRVELPISGRNVWPFLDVDVLNSQGKAVPVRRSGIEWHKLLIAVPAERTSFVVQAVRPAGESSPIRSEKERQVADTATGLKISICNWYDGRQTALSLRFDDSHPTHLSTVIPLLNEYGFRGTFMVNPGGHPPNSRRRSAFEDHRAEWEAVARSGKHEFANHTLNHQGAPDDESMEREVGDAAKAIWRLFPQKSKLTALNLGGGTQWVTTRTLRYYLDKYHQFDASANSTGMDDVYGNRVETFRRLLAAALASGVRYKVHYHDIGTGGGASEAHFREVLEIIKEHEKELWIAGLADIHKYETERRSSKLELEHKPDSLVVVKLSCGTNPELYDQPLTIDVLLPDSWADQRVSVTNEKTNPIAVRRVSLPAGVVLRFDVEPRDTSYTIEKSSSPN